MVEPDLRGALCLPRWVLFCPAVHHHLAQFWPPSAFMYLKDKNTDWCSLDIAHHLLRSRNPPVKCSCPCCAMRTFNWVLNEGAACNGGSCHVHTKIGTWQCLIICIQLPIDVQIPSGYFHLLSSYFHCTNAIPHLLPLHSNSSIASDPACTWRFLISSPSVSFDSTVPLATAFLN